MKEPHPLRRSSSIHGDRAMDFYKPRRVLPRANDHAGRRFIPPIFIIYKYRACSM